MTPQELLKPRFKVIAEFPKCWYVVGELLPSDSNCNFDVFPDHCFDAAYIQKYPHLFKELQWWEDREEKDMPEYVKVITDGTFDFIDGDIYDENAKEVEVKFPGVGEIIKVADGYEWGLMEVCAHLLSKKDRRVEIHASYLIPATESEYQSYTQSLTIKQ